MASGRGAQQSPGDAGGTPGVSPRDAKEGELGAEAAPDHGLPGGGRGPGEEAVPLVGLRVWTASVDLSRQKSTLSRQCLDNVGRSARGFFFLSFFSPLFSRRGAPILFLL